MKIRRWKAPIDPDAVSIPESATEFLAEGFDGSIKLWDTPRWYWTAYTRKTEYNPFGEYGPQIRRFRAYQDRDAFLAGEVAHYRLERARHEISQLQLEMWMHLPYPKVGDLFGNGRVERLVLEIKKPELWPGDQYRDECVSLRVLERELEPIAGVRADPIEVKMRLSSFRNWISMGAKLIEVSPL